MSAFVVEDITINRVVSWIRNVMAAGHSSEFFWALKPLEKLRYQLDSTLGCKRLAEEMFTLNCEAVEQRYGEGEAEKFRDLNFEFGTASPGSIYQVLKSLSCWLYQCSEGNVPEASPLYKALQDLSRRICEVIVTRQPEYDRAVWG